MNPADNLSAPQKHAALIVCERSGTWATAWRRLLDGEGIRVVETRALADCVEALEDWPAATVAVELTAASADDTLAWLAAAERDFPAAVVLVMAGRELAGYEELTRELGAAWFVTSPRELPALVELVRRHAKCRSEEQQPVEAQVRARLPWG